MCVFCEGNVTAHSILPERVCAGMCVFRHFGVCFYLILLFRCQTEEAGINLILSGRIFKQSLNTSVPTAQKKSQLSTSLQRLSLSRGTQQVEQEKRNVPSFHEKHNQSTVWANRLDKSTLLAILRELLHCLLQQLISLSLRPSTLLDF